MTSQKRPSSRKSIAYMPSPDLDTAISNKENNDARTLDAGELFAAASTGIESKQRKTRSKSLGPGGLDALREDAGNKRKIAPAPRSILKPYIPLSPLKEIPPRKPTAQPRPAFRSPSKNTQSTTSPSRQTRSSASPARMQSQSPSKQSQRETVPSSEPAIDAAQLERQRLREAAQKQRDARRKSLANRRVSFAPEATLHTFDNLEDMQDSTTSSTSPNSTRRASSLTQNSLSVAFQGHRDNDHSSPMVADENHDGQRQQGMSPIQREGPDISQADFDGVGDDAPSSPFSNVPAENGLYPNLEQSPDGHESAQSPHESLQEEEDDDDGTAMEIVGDEVTTAFRSFAQQRRAGLQSAKQAILLEQENINPFSPAFKAGQRGVDTVNLAQSVYDNTDMSMDITRAIGGIVRQASVANDGARPSPKRRKSLARSRRSSGASESSQDATMELTTAIGGIRAQDAESDDGSSVDENEDLSMEFTNVLGGIRGRTTGKQIIDVVDADMAASNVDDEDVEMENSETMEMDMTTALGKVMPRNVDASSSEQIGNPRAVEASPGRQMPATRNGPAERTPLRKAGPSSLLRAATTASINVQNKAASPRGRGRSRKSQEDENSPTTPTKGLRTPEKQITPQPAARPSTPSKTPPPNIAMRHPSPRKLFAAEIKQAKSSPSTRSPRTGLFEHDEARGTHTPRVRLEPKAPIQRRASGLGFDKAGLGSSQVAELLDRRASIGDQADVFALNAAQNRAVRFTDPKQLEVEVTKEQLEDRRRESGQSILQSEAEAELMEQDATMTLKDAIIGMSPKKVKAKGRKSLAIGAGKGLLGKRPRELDEDDSDEDGTPNTLRGREGSPVKKIRLQAPPSAFESTWRVSSFRASLGPTAGNAQPMTPTTKSPLRKLASTPTHEGHFTNIVTDDPIFKFSSTPKASQPLQTTSNEVATSDESRIGLQEFLNLTSIRFMELNTTKRRHTVVQNKREDVDAQMQQDPQEQFADAVVAGACTLPMLELYQHSCRELRKYISEGRKVVREIEVATSEDNPQLFKEYMSASPSDRTIMDNQFKNMKTHARHLSKGMWYEWRMKLLEGLGEGLLKEAQGLENDEALISEQEQHLASVVPALIAEHEQLLREASDLQQQAQDIADCDQDELSEARRHLSSADLEVEEKKQRLARMRAEARSLDESIANGRAAAQEHHREIREALRVRDEYRGWSESEVLRLREKVDAVEAQHGWAIATATGSQLTMVYRSQLELSFDIAAFASKKHENNRTIVENVPIRLSWIDDTHDPMARSLLLATPKRFYLQLMQAHLQSIQQQQTTAKDLLTFISSTWSEASSLCSEIAHLDTAAITHCEILNDQRLAVRTMLLVPTASARVNLTFEVGAVVSGMKVAVKLTTKAASVYGQHYRDERLRDFLKTRIGENMAGGAGNWVGAVRELRQKLIAQGRT